MALKVGSGILRGMALMTPAGLQTRPTSGKTRAAVLDMLQPYLIDAVVMDGFAGSGAMGIEACSRGAKHVYFIEKANLPFKALSHNLELARQRLAKIQALEDRATLSSKCQDLLSLRFNPVAPKLFDLIWLDPPYVEAENLLAQCLPMLSSFLSLNGHIIIESDKSSNIDYEGYKLELIKTKLYGITKIEMFSKLI